MGNIRIVAQTRIDEMPKVIESQAKASKQTVSEWIRSTLNAAVQQ
jgi:hypothetical protein